MADGVPPLRPSARRPGIPPGLELGMPIDSPKLPTEALNGVPVSRVMWFQPKRMSLTRVVEIDRVQSPTTFQMGATADPLASMGSELVIGSVSSARVNRP